MTLPVFGHVTLHRQPLADGPASEAGWLALAAATGRAAAHLWQAPEGLVVPLNTRAAPGWAAADRTGVQLRSSGGGLVPQGPGVWNLSLAWPAPSAEPQGTDAVYAGLCCGLAAAFARLGVAATPHAVPGAWCDGRWNLAIAGRKCVGTAQAWRRMAGRPMVLAHAVIVSSADPEALTACANAFEDQLGRGLRYRADGTTSLALAAGRAPGPAFDAQVAQLVAEQFARVVPPHVKETSTHGAA